MRFLLKSASFIFHPLWLPLAGSFLYFIFTPRFFPEGVVQAKLLAIAILTIFIPIVFYFLLKNLGKAQSVFLVDVNERKWPLIFYAILITIGLVLLLTRILPNTTVWNKLILSSTVGDATFNNAAQGESEPVVGALGKSVSELYPIGQVELEGRRYEARSSLGKISKGAVIKVTGRDDHGLIVVKK